ncbi:MAG: FhaA domain-containing protein, partial [Vulcanimicrobiaceae bacterium]
MTAPDFAGWLARFEASCSALVEHAFARAFPSALEPVQVARKLVAAFEGGPSGGRGGRRFIVRLDPSDAARFEPDRVYLEARWGEMLARLAER